MNNHASVFEIFKIEDKIEELKILLGKDGFSKFDNKYVTIAVPIYDESLRNINSSDHELFLTQQNDAHQLQQFLLNNTKAKGINLALVQGDVTNIADKGCEIDHLILLHEFTQNEEDCTIQELMATCDKNLEVYKLY